MSRYLTLGLVLVLLVLVVPPSVSAASVVPMVATGSPVTLQEYGTLERQQAFVQQFWQNGSGVYATGSTVFSVPYDAGGLPVAWTQLPYLNFSYHFIGDAGYYPVVQIVQQSTCPVGTYCWNMTGADFSISPSVSTTPVNSTIPAAFTAAGLTPSSPVKYEVAVNATTSLGIALLTPGSWEASGIAQTLNTTVVVPTNYTLNATRIFVPYASNVTLNATSLNVTLNGKSVVASTQVVAGGIYVNLPGLAANASLSIRGTVQTVNTNRWVSVGLGTAASTGVAGQYSASAYWTNGGVSPYTSGFIITTNLTYAINPLSLNISMNGKYIPPARFFLAGTTIEILPGSVVVAANGVAGFLVRFTFSSPVPTVVGKLSTPIIGTATAGEILLVLIGVTVAVVIYGGLIGPVQARKMPGGRRWNPTSPPSYWYIAIVFLLFFVAVFTYLGIVGGWTL